MSTNLIYLTILNFIDCGAIQDVIFQDAASAGPPPKQISDAFGSADFDGFKVCYLVFERPSSVKSAMSNPSLSKPKVISAKENPTGIEKWRQQYNQSICLDTEKLSKLIEESVAKIDQKKAEEERKAVEGEEDEDGWVTVNRHNTKAPLGKRSDKAQARIKAKEAKKRKRKELQNFYRHQLTEKKLKRMEELKEKFELDKKKQSNNSLNKML